MYVCGLRVKKNVVCAISKKKNLKSVCAASPGNGQQQQALVINLIFKIRILSTWVECEFVELNTLIYIRIGVSR